MKSFLANAKAVIIFSDHAGWLRANAVRETAQELGIRTEMHLVSRLTEASFVAEESETAREAIVWRPELQDEDDLLLAYLGSQTIGTRVFSCGEAGMVQRLQRLIRAAGFGLQEAFFEVIGNRRDQIFCVRCSTLNPPSSEKYIRCENCGRILEVSSHYSKRLRAVLGYLTVAEQLQGREVNFPENN